MIAAFTAFGATKPQCLMAIEDWNKSAEAFFKGDPWTRAFDETFWEQYEAWDDDEIEDMPLESLPKDRFVDTLIHLLRYAVEEQESDHARILGELLYEEIDVKKDVELKQEVDDDDSGDYQRTYVYDHRKLLIKDVEVASWTLGSERSVYDPFTFESQVEEMEIYDMPGSDSGETPWAVNNALEALHIEEPEVRDPYPPVSVEFCPEGVECKYAVVYIGDFDCMEPICLAVQYKDVFNAREGLEASESLLENWCSRKKIEEATISIAVRRSPQDRKEFEDRLRAMDLALTQKTMFEVDPLVDPELQALAEMDDDELELRRTWRLIDADEVSEIADRELRTGRPSYGGW
jgi:hypothetical protein